MKTNLRILRSLTAASLALFALLPAIHADDLSPYVFTRLHPDDIPGVYSYHGWRITQIRVEDPSIPTFSVGAIANTGAWAIESSSLS